MEQVVFLFDVDNTLVDNDRIAADLKRYLTHEVGEGRQQQYWEIFEQLRAELGYADYLGALRTIHSRTGSSPARSTRSSTRAPSARPSSSRTATSSSSPSR